MSTYKVRCAWEDGAWVVTSTPKRRGVHTQCKRLDQVQARIAEAAHLMTGESIEDIRVEIVEITGSPVIEKAMAVRQRREAAAAAAREAERETEKVIGAARSAGFAYRDIGTLTGISHQRAQQIAGPETAKARTGRRA